MMKMRYALAVVLAVAAPARSQSTPASFCERLAVPLKMKLNPVLSTREQAVWRVDSASFGMYLVGGSTATSISISPVDPADLAKDSHPEDECRWLKSGVACPIKGPVHLKLRTRKAMAELDASPGEMAEVEVRSSVVLCREPHASH